MAARVNPSRTKTSRTVVTATPRCAPAPRRRQRGRVPPGPGTVRAPGEPVVQAHLWWLWTPECLKDRQQDGELRDPRSAGCGRPGRSGFPAPSPRTPGSSVCVRASPSATRSPRSWSASWWVSASPSVAWGCGSTWWPCWSCRATGVPLSPVEVLLKNERDPRYTPTVRSVRAPSSSASFCWSSEVPVAAVSRSAASSAAWWSPRWHGGCCTSDFPFHPQGSPPRSPLSRTPPTEASTWAR